MKLTTDELEQILSPKIDPVATHLAIHNKHVFAERLHRRVHNLEDLREILALRQEIERLKSEQSEVAARAIESLIENETSVFRLHNGEKRSGDLLFDSSETEKFRIVDEHYKHPNMICGESSVKSPKGVITYKPNDWYKRGDLPPEGELVEYRGEQFELIAYRSWEGDLLAILYSPLHGYTKNLEAKPELFKPIQSDRDKLVAEMVAVFEKAACKEVYSMRDGMEALIDKGYRKIKPMSEEEFRDKAIQVAAMPNNWNTKVFSETLYLAGCRFIEEE